jgi:ribosomal protein S21
MSEYIKPKLSKSSKELMSIVPGSFIASHVIDGDLSLAMRRIKKALKTSDKLNEVKDKSEYVKPSVRKKNMLSRAKYINGKLNGK